MFLQHVALLSEGLCSGLLCAYNCGHSILVVQPLHDVLQGSLDPRVVSRRPFLAGILRAIHLRLTCAFLPTGGPTAKRLKVLLCFFEDGNAIWRARNSLDAHRAV